MNAPTNRRRFLVLSCEKCEGTGEQRRDFLNHDGNIQAVAYFHCDKCNGTGRVEREILNVIERE